MFDWFNPKPAKKTEGETKSDIFSNFFNQVGPKEAASENKVAKEEEVTIAAEIPSPPKEEAAEEEIEITSEAPVESESILPEADIEHQVHKGTVRWFDRRKGYGFIIPESGENDIFVHQSEIVCSGYRLLIDGEDVEYSVTADSEGRPRAMHVTGPGGGDVRVVEIRGQREKKEEWAKSLYLILFIEKEVADQSKSNYLHRVAAIKGSFNQSS